MSLTFTPSVRTLTNWSPRLSQEPPPTSTPEPPPAATSEPTTTEIIVELDGQQYRTDGVWRKLS